AQRLGITADRMQRALDQLDDDIEPRMSLVLDRVHANRRIGINPDDRTFRDLHARTAERPCPYHVAVAKRVSGLESDPSVRRIELDDALGRDEHGLPRVDADAMLGRTDGRADEETEQGRCDQPEE